MHTPLRSFRAAIFDLDGTLIDTEVLWKRTYTEMLEQSGKDRDPEIHARLMGKIPQDCADILKQTYHFSGDTEELMRFREKTYQAIEQDSGVRVKPGAERLLNALVDAGISLGLATGASRAYVDQIFTKNGWGKLFSVVLSIEDIPHGKPAPDIYLEAIARLGCSSDEAICFEDSPTGVLSAKRAGLKVVGVLDDRLIQALPEADMVVGSLEEMTLARLNSCFFLSHAA